jgi:type IX secretion system PorP/SprF family membrane protein
VNVSEKLYISPPRKANNTGMKYFQLLTFVVSILWITSLQGQDIHYTLFNMSPMTLNPALTGAYEGTARVGGIYRDQWANVIGFQYRTPGVYLDAPIVRGLGKNDWIGVGAVNVNDVAGSIFLETNVSGLSLAYHAAMGKNSVLTLGVQGTRVQRRVNIGTAGAAVAWLEDGYQNGRFGNSQDLRNIRENLNYTDINAGLMLRTKMAGNRSLEIGISGFHLNTPRYALHDTTFIVNEEAAQRPMRMSMHAQYFMPYKGKWSLNPTVLIQTTSGAFEAVGQLWGIYDLKKDVKLNVGAGYRLGDALQVLVGMDYEDLRVAASYDMNLSSLAAASQTVGGFEVSAWYILKVYKKPDIKPIIFCPRF